MPAWITDDHDTTTMSDPFPPDSDPWQQDDPVDLTDSFWGGKSAWEAQPVDRAEPVDGPAGAVKRWWSSATAGRARAAGARGHQRSHGTPTTDELPIVVAHSAPGVAEEFPIIAADSAPVDPAWPDDWDTPVEPVRSGVDPLLARLGGFAVIITLLVPVVIGFTSSDSGDDDLVRTAAATQPESTIASPNEATVPASTAAAASTAITATAAPIENSDPTTPSPTVPATTAAAIAVENTTAAATLTADPCGEEYEIVAGDFWIRIADGSDDALADLLSVNNATINTALFPGRTICLPVGATTPPPPVASTERPVAPTTAATTNPPATTASPTTQPTTQPPATQAPAPAPTPTTPPASNASAAEVQAIIRAAWPDELEDRALEIAWRESNYRPTAKNFCCYGLFQIYWNVHRGWLDDIGITSAEQLLDPTLNARAALALYERSGGWGPWGG